MNIQMYRGQNVWGPGSEQEIALVNLVRGAFGTFFKTLCRFTKQNPFSFTYVDSPDNACD
jgi:hypothetical protein